MTHQDQLNNLQMDRNMSSITALSHVIAQVSVIVFCLLTGILSVAVEGGEILVSVPRCIFPAALWILYSQRQDHLQLQYLWVGCSLSLCTFFCPWPALCSTVSPNRRKQINLVFPFFNNIDTAQVATENSAEFPLPLAWQTSLSPLLIGTF